MIKSGTRFIWLIVIPLALMVATSGCATKKYVRNQVAPVNQKVAKLETHTNQKIAAVSAREASDISQVNERISTTDERVTQVASAAQQAQGTASRAMDQVDANSTAITTLHSDVANALNYQLVQKADVTFAFNKSTLTPEARAELDQIASKVQSMPRAVVEVSGFTDRTGSRNYNLALSHRRAWAVQRYLVMKNVPLRSIHIVGLGEEAPPAGMEMEPTETNPHPTRAQVNRMSRRVRISVYGAGELGEPSASRSEP